MAAHPPSSFAEQYNNPDISSAYLRIFKFLTIFSFMGFAFYAFFYWQTQTWQFLIAAVFLLISLIITVAGFHQVKRGHSSVANVLVFLGLIFAYSAPLLLWSHAEGYLIIAGLFVSIPVSMVLYTQWKQRIAAIGIFLLISILLSQVPVFTRYDIHSLPALNIFLFASAVFIILQSTWLLIRKIDIRTIKARLLISFIIIAVVPMVIVAGVATTSVIRGTENNAIDLLTVVLNLKVTAIHTWIDNLQQIMRQDFDVAADNDSLLGLLESEPGSTRFNEYGNDIQKRLEISLKTTPDFVDYLILDRNGLIRLSTDPSYAGVNISQESYIRDALSIHSYNRIIDIPVLGGKVLLVTEPILNQMNTPAGLKVGIANLDKLTQIMGEGDVMGETGEAYLVASDLTLLTESRFPSYPTGETKILTRGGLDAILGKQDGTGTYDNYTGTEILAAYHWLGDLDVAIFAEQSRSELFSPVLGTTLIIMLVSIFLIAGAVIFGLSISNSIGKPLAELTSVSQRIATGELDLVATVEKRQDEISDLADAFNKMTQQLRIFINDLERQVQSRTTEYETRNAQLLAASQLGNAITSFLDTDELVQQSVNLIQEKFSLYYVGLFLLDETHTLATLKAGTGHTGRAMVEQGHGIRVGEGMIGWCIQHSRARIALQAGEDPIRLATPDLPETRSEAAIPLRSRGLVIGALTIQSKHSNAFDEAMITIFQTMADQIAIAIDNAMLIDQAQKAIEATRKAYGELSHRAWMEQISSKWIKAYCGEHGVAISSQRSGFTENDPNLGVDSISSNGNGDVLMPIKVRGSTLGVLTAQKRTPSESWSDEETEMLRTLTEQLGAALDSARLFEETLTRAERERMIGHIAGRVRETLDIETVLKTATLEMRRVLDLDEVEVRMNQNILQDQTK